jgi:hypothetical protein
MAEVEAAKKEADELLLRWEFLEETKVQSPER